MSDWRRFDATGEPGTCIWCGRKLRRKAWRIWNDQPLLDGYRWTARGGESALGTWRVAEGAELGDYQDGVFCGLRCGYQFGARMAELGSRLARGSGA